jgi:hypothetical protein
MKGGGASLVESFGCVGMGHVPQIGQFGLRLVASVKSVLCPKGKCPKGNPLEWLSCQRTPDQSHILNLAGEQSNPALIRLSMGRSRPDLSQIFRTWPWPSRSGPPSDGPGPGPALTQSRRSGWATGRSDPGPYM